MGSFTESLVRRSVCFNISVLTLFRLEYLIDFIMLDSETLLPNTPSHLQNVRCAEGFALFTDPWKSDCNRGSFSHILTDE